MLDSRRVLHPAPSVLALLGGKHISNQDLFAILNTGSGVVCAYVCGLTWKMVMFVGCTSVPAGAGSCNGCVRQGRDSDSAEAGTAHGSMADPQLAASATRSSGTAPTQTGVTLRPRKGFRVQGAHAHTILTPCRTLPYLWCQQQQRRP